MTSKKIVDILSPLQVKHYRLLKEQINDLYKENTKLKIEMKSLKENNIIIPHEKIKLLLKQYPGGEARFPIFPEYEVTVKHITPRKEQ